MLSFSSSFAEKADETVQNCRWFGQTPYCSFEIKANKEYHIPNWDVISVSEMEQWDKYWNSKGYRSADYDGINYFYKLEYVFIHHQKQNYIIHSLYLEYQ